MRILITGASGFVGRQLVPLLQERGATLLLVGRDPERLRGLFPQTNAIRYEDIAEVAAGYDMLVHLAVINNDQNVAWNEVERINVDLAVHTCRQARAAGIGAFVLMFSTHALHLDNTSDYASSKRMAAEKIAEIESIAKFAIFLPAVAGDVMAGKLAVLNRFSESVRRPLLSVLGALRPTVHMDVIADGLLGLKWQGKEGGVRRVILSDGQDENWLFRSVKRLIDIALSLVIVTLLWWLILTVWIGVRLFSPGPGIFKQVRVGRNEKQFTCLKFRTMHLSAPNIGTHEVSASAVTPIGRILRRTKLDELPQILNVLRNEMSFVGPRPCLPSQAVLIEERRSRGVFRATPGITGFAQIQGLDMSNPAALAASDLEYLQLQSLVLDAKIIAKTALGGGSGDNVRS